MTTRGLLTACLAAFALSGCGASLPGLTTGSLFGSSASTAGPAAAPQVANDPMSRALQVAMTSARALKCGFNFDPVKLRTQYLVADTATLTNPADAAKLTQTYDVAFNGMSKAVVNQGEGYCSQTKTNKIKEALNRHLAGDYTPPAPEPVQDDGGLFGSLSSGDSSTYRDSNPLRRDE